MQFDKCLMLIFLLISTKAKGSSSFSCYSSKYVLLGQLDQTGMHLDQTVLKQFFSLLEVTHSQLGTVLHAVLDTYYWGHLPLSPLSKKRRVLYLQFSIRFTVLQSQKSN